MLTSPSHLDSHSSSLCQNLAGMSGLPYLAFSFHKSDRSLVSLAATLSASQLLHQPLEGSMNHSIDVVLVPE